MTTTSPREIEANFINFDVESIKAKLTELGAEDRDEVLLKERIFYPEPRVRDGVRRFVRIRELPGKTFMTYKEHQELKVDGTEEIEFEITDADKAVLFIERMGWYPIRVIEKHRHSFVRNGILYDFDVWPIGTPMLQIEGPSGEAVQRASEELGFKWADALFGSPVDIMTKHMGVDFEGYKVATFSKLERYDD